MKHLQQVLLLPLQLQQELVQGLVLVEVVEVVD
jgi:hypothetical protein